MHVGRLFHHVWNSLLSLCTQGYIFLSIKLGLVFDSKVRVEYNFDLYLKKKPNKNITKKKKKKKPHIFWKCKSVELLMVFWDIFPERLTDWPGKKNICYTYHFGGYSNKKIKLSSCPPSRGCYYNAYCAKAPTFILCINKKFHMKDCFVHLQSMLHLCPNTPITLCIKHYCTLRSI